jgi:spore germination protein GerM
MSLRAKLLVLILAVVLGAGSFYLRSLARRVFWEPAQHGEEAIRTRLSEAALQPARTPSQTATLYFPSLNDRRLVPESRSVTWAETDADRVRQILLALIEGSHQGLGRVLPASVNIRAIFLAPEGTAYVDFSSEFPAGLAPGIESESLAVYALTNSITTNISSVKKVKLLIQGQEVETLGGHADLTGAFVPDPTRIQTAPGRP